MNGGTLLTIAPPAKMNIKGSGNHNLSECILIWQSARVQQRGNLPQIGGEWHDDL
jgi:hypothetical protein